MFSFVFVVNCKCLSWCTWLPQFPLWPRCSCCFYLRFPFSMTDHWVSPHLVFPLLFFLQLFPIFACCCLAIYLLISVFAVHCTVLGAVDFCSLCVPICMSQDSSEIYAYCCWCFMCLSALLCFCRLHFSSLPLSTSTASYQSEMDMNQSTLTKVKYQMQKKTCLHGSLTQARTMKNIERLLEATHGHKVRDAYVVRNGQFTILFRPFVLEQLEVANIHSIQFAFLHLFHRLQQIEDILGSLHLR